MSRSLRRDAHGLSAPYQALVVVVMIGVLVGVFYVLVVKPLPPPFRPTRAEAGDTVTIGYIGTFNDTGRLFDTSYRSVAFDNASYPKAASFTWRTNWQNFSFEIGSGQAIVGFDKGVRGMAVGETKRVIVPPEDGYGQRDASRVFERPLLQEVPAREELNVTAFGDRFGAQPVDGLVVVDPFWRWNVSVAISNNIVMITHSPQILQTVRPYGGAWDARVESIDDSANNGTGIVYVRHMLTPDDVPTVLGTENGEQFTLLSVDLDQGVYVANFNREVVGETLVFDITVAAITRP